MVSHNRTTAYKDSRYGERVLSLAAKWLCHYLVFIFVHDITDSVRFERLNRDVVSPQNSDQ